MSEGIIRNAMQTPDGTIIESRSRHDYVEHLDAVTGKVYMVDGGLSYLRRSISPDAVDLSVFLSDGHEAVREALTWGTYGKSGREPLRLVALKDMETDHIQACLDNVPNMLPQFREGMENELNYRDEHYANV